MTGRDYETGGFYAAPKRNELSFAAEQERTRELRSLQRGAPLTRLSSGGRDELSEAQKSDRINNGTDWVTRSPTA